MACDKSPEGCAVGCLDARHVLTLRREMRDVTSSGVYVVDTADQWEALRIAKFYNDFLRKGARLRLCAIGKVAEKAGMVVEVENCELQAAE